jgi:hypothetical protein
MSQSTDAPRRSLFKLPDNLPPGYLVLWGILIVSLALNILSTVQIFALRQAARQAIADGITLIGNLEGSTLSYNVAVDDTLPLTADIPVDETIPVVIEDTIPIDTTVTVPVSAGLLGTFDLDVPIHAVVPIRLETEVTLQRTFHVETNIPLDLTIPVSIVVRDSPAAQSLADLKMRLERLAALLGGPLQ